MCKSCWGYENGGDPFKNFRRGGVEPDDFEKEVDYRPRTRKTKKKNPSPKPGCPGNDGAEHIYVWTTEREVRDFFFDYYGYHRYESHICVGCGKNGHRRRHTEKYEKRKHREWTKRYGGEFDVKRGEPLSRWGRGPNYRWWSWENYDPEYTAKRREYIARHGYTSYIYGF